MTVDEKYPLALTSGSVLAGRYIVEKVLGQGALALLIRRQTIRPVKRSQSRNSFLIALLTEREPL